jgi:formate dehydrogenase
VDTFYKRDKTHKRIIEPDYVVTPRFDAYSQGEPFAALRGMLARGARNDTLSMLEDSGLRGCGGAGFPLVSKWRAALSNPGPRYLIVNGQEGELYTFKDYYLMTRHSRLVVEGAAIAALALDAAEVIIVVNSAYRECLEAIRESVSELRRRLFGLCAPEMQVLSGPEPDLYVCGEETALIEYLEGRRGEAQLRPPFPHQQGYKGRPTVVQNVETLSWIPLLITHPGLFASEGTLKLLTLFGAVRNPGIYEMPLGVPISRLLEQVGGLTDGSTLQAIEVGGMAGGFLPPDYMELPLEHGTMLRCGASIGTGSVRFLNQQADLIKETLDAMVFFREENCGRCTPCRVGTQELARITAQLSMGAPLGDEEDWLSDISETLSHASLCGLGKRSPSLLLSLIRYWNIDQGRVLPKRHHGPVMRAGPVLAGSSPRRKKALS